jgi:hypothetical protein
MRREPNERVRRKPRHWRRMGMMAAAGVLSLAGCSSLDSGSTAQAPDPFLGPTTGPLAKTTVATVQPPPGAIAPAGVLPAAAAPNTNVSVAALAPTSVHPMGDREDLHIGSPRSANGQGWAAPGPPAVAAAGGQATLTAPADASTSPERGPAPVTLAQNTSPTTPTLPVSSQPQQQPAQPASYTPPAQPQQQPQRPLPDPAPTTVDAAGALLAKKGANWQPPTQNAQTGDWTFRCVVPNANKIRTYEGHGRDQLTAMIAVLDEINQAQ